MKYFIVNNTIKDGEYEYFCQRPSKGKTMNEAIKVIEKENKEWIEEDYRIQEIGSVREITKKEYEIIHKYIY
jgi:hypothetical protein